MFVRYTSDAVVTSVCMLSIHPSVVVRVGTLQRRHPSWLHLGLEDKLGQTHGGVVAARQGQVHNALCAQELLGCRECLIRHLFMAQQLVYQVGDNLLLFGEPCRSLPRADRSDGLRADSGAGS